MVCLYVVVLHFVMYMCLVYCLRARSIMTIIMIIIIIIVFIIISSSSSSSSSSVVFSISNSIDMFYHFGGEACHARVLGHGEEERRVGELREDAL